MSRIFITGYVHNTIKVPLTLNETSNVYSTLISLNVVLEA